MGLKRRLLLCNYIGDWTVNACVLWRIREVLNTPASTVYYSLLGRGCSHLVSSRTRCQHPRASCHKNVHRSLALAKLTDCPSENNKQCARDAIGQPMRSLPFRISLKCFSGQQLLRLGSPGMDGAYFLALMMREPKEPRGRSSLCSGWWASRRL